MTRDPRKRVAQDLTGSIVALSWCSTVVVRQQLTDDVRDKQIRSKGFHLISVEMGWMSRVIIYIGKVASCCQIPAC